MTYYLVGRMLQQYVARAPVAVTEVEQAPTHDCAYLPVLEVDRPDTRDLAVGHEHVAPRAREPHRLGEGRLAEVAVDVVFAAASGPGRKRRLRRVEHPDLMAPGHRDEDLLPDGDEPPGRAQRHAARVAGIDGRHSAPLLAGSGHRPHRQRIQVDGADQVVARVGDVERPSDERHALRIVKRRLARGSVVRADAPLPHDRAHVAGQVRYHDPVVAAVGDVEPVERDMQLSRKAEKRQLRFRVGRDLEPLAAEHPVAPPLSEEVFDFRHERFILDLSRDRLANVAGGVDQHQSRPGVDAEPLPELVLGVDDDGMRDTVPPDGLSDVLGVLLGKELRRVDADDDHRIVRKPIFDPGQDRQEMQAVDSTEGPEVEHRHATPQVAGGAERAARVEPGNAGQKLRAANRRLHVR